MIPPPFDDFPLSQPERKEYREDGPLPIKVKGLTTDAPSFDRLNNNWGICFQGLKEIEKVKGGMVLVRGIGSRLIDRKSPVQKELLAGWVLGLKWFFLLSLIKSHPVQRERPRRIQSHMSSTGLATSAL